MDLTQQKCVPCEGGVKPFDEPEIQLYLSYLKTTWNIDDNKKIEKKFTFKGFKDAIAFVNKVAEIAESEGHHPDIEVSYNIVELKIWTHAVGGLSVNDFILARKIESIV